MSAERRIALAEVLFDLEAALRQLGWWQAEPPPEDALASTEPFCIDTLEFAQWLQFILLPRFRYLLDAGLPLPERCSISPVAEMQFQGLNADTRLLMQVLQRLDDLFPDTD